MHQDHLSCQFVGYRKFVETILLTLTEFRESPNMNNMFHHITELLSEGRIIYAHSVIWTCDRKRVHSVDREISVIWPAAIEIPLGSSPKEASDIALVS
jgi:hypothetical protein